MKNQKAFTMAEVLIAMGVIGIVAVLTIPVIAKFSTNLETTTAFKNTYSDLSNVSQIIKKDNNQTLVDAFSSTAAMKNRYAEYMKTTKNCTNSSTDGCWTYKWNQMDGTELTPPTSPGLILINGAILVFEDYFSSSCDSSGTNVSARTTLTNVCSDIMIDVNGARRPNIIGKDIFYVWILSNSIKPWGTDADDAKTGSMASSETCDSGDGGWGCAGKLLKNQDD